MHICLLWARKRRRWGTNKQQEQHAFAPRLWMRNMWRTLAGWEGVPGIIIRWGRGLDFGCGKDCAVRRQQTTGATRVCTGKRGGSSRPSLQRDLLDCSQSLFCFVILTDKQARKKEESEWDKFLSVFWHLTRQMLVCVWHGDDTAPNVTLGIWMWNNTWHAEPSLYNRAFSFRHDALNWEGRGGVRMSF